jgi:antitoxin ParD1/3/4
MNVSLTPELEAYISRLVEEGTYRSASEVVRSALRSLQDLEEERQLRLKALTESIDAGLQQLAAADRVSADEVFEQILEGLGRSEAA